MTDELNEDGDKIVNVDDYEDENYKRFISDVKSNGYEPIHYNGRWFYSGPSIVVEDIQVGIRATDMTIGWDNMGHDFIIYPTQKNGGN